jgi:hypothetical protein
MLQALRKKLRSVPFLHGFYMRIKRVYTGELVGMTSKSEQEYFGNYGKNIYQGKGEIVDLGCWLGSTTIPLVKGLLQNPQLIASKRKVYAYDAFIWYDSMTDAVAGTELVGKYRDGDSFLDEYQRRTQEFAEFIEIRAGDLKEIGWNGAEIEFLLVDAMKNWELANAIIKDFYPHLIPLESLVLHQDFAHYFTVWIHLLQWKFRDYFEFVEEIPKGASVVFRNIKKIPAEMIKNYSFADFLDEDINNAFDYSLGFVSDEKKANILAAKAMCFIFLERISDAQQLLQDYSQQGVLIKDDLLTIEQLINQNKD